MTDLLQVLPDFDIKPYSHLLPKLEKALVSVNDLLTLEPAHVAKHAQLPAGDLKKLRDAIVGELHRHLGFGEEERSEQGAPNDAREPESGWRCISTLDEKLDAALGGGIPPGHLVEVTGER
jgi:DNA repair protein RAD57